MTSKMIGSIYACIDGDHRYGTRLNVMKLADGGVQIRLVGTSPIGGMDGPGGTFDKETRLKGWDKAPSPSELLKELKRLIRTTDGGTIQRYGTPTKKFEWYIDGEVQCGLNAKLAKAALDS